MSIYIGLAAGIAIGALVASTLWLIWAYRAMRP